MTAKNSSNEIHLIRIYDAPLLMVWEAWTDTQQVEQWWGPRDFTLTTHAKDLKAGGFWKYTMHGPDGVDYPNTTQYIEVQKHAKLVYDHGGSDERPPLFRLTVLFSESGGKTKVDLTSTLPSPEAAVETRAFIKKAGGNSTWDRLAEFLSKKISGEEKFFINRTFDAPIQVMFDLWTDPKHFAQWLPPTGFTMEFIECEIKPGGSSFYYMTNGAGMKMYGTVNYITIERPHRIVYTQQFADEHRKIARHPMAPTWPATMLTTVTLAEEGANRTRLTVMWQPYGAATREEIETFIKAKSGMTQGWTGSFDKLEAHIEQTAKS